MANGHPPGWRRGWRAPGGPAVTGVLALVLAACGGGPGTGTPRTTYLIEASTLEGIPTQSVRIVEVVDGEVDRSNLVSDAVVSLDGQPLTLDASGSYTGDLAAFPAAGDVLELLVTIGDIELTATGTVPAEVELTAPVHWTHFVPGDPIAAEWTVPGSPDRYTFKVEYGGSSTTFDVADGDARRAELPAAVIELLPSDASTVTIQAFAIDDAEFTGPAHPASSWSVENGSSWATRPTFTYGPTPPTLPVSYLIRAPTLGPSPTGWLTVQKVVNDDLYNVTPVTDAVVSINGDPFTLQVPATGQYHGAYTTVPGAGDVLDLRVEVDGDVVTGSVTVPQPMVLTAPTDGAHFTPGDPIVVQWTGAASPDRYSFLVTYTGGNDWFYEPDGAARQATLPDGTVARLPTDSSPIGLQLVAVNEGTFTGPSHATSQLAAEIRTDWISRPTFTYGPTPP